MKKKILCLCLIAGLLFSTVLPVRAETYDRSDAGWYVTYSGGNKLETNFKKTSFSDELTMIQPGDTVKFSILLKNENSAATDWYMTNKITRSLEEKYKEANGGAYTYILTYTAVDGSTIEFFNSDKVGGEIGNGDETGLYEATKELEREFFLVDTLSQGQTGTVNLTVTLEGETQGNDYQDTLADLEMEFAVERRPSPVYEYKSPKERIVERGGEIIFDEDVPRDVIRSNTVRTSDDNRLIIFSIITAVSGLLLLLMALYCRKAKREEKE